MSETVDISTPEKQRDVAIAESDRLRSRVADLEAQLAGARTAFNVAADSLAHTVCLGMTINQLSRIGVIQVGIERALAAITPEAPATLPADQETPDPQH